MASKKKSYKGKKQYATYLAQSRASKNRVAKLKRHLKSHASDTQAVKALKHEKTFRSRAKVKGNHPAPSRNFRNAAGHLVVMPAFGRRADEV